MEADTETPGGGGEERVGGMVGGMAMGEEGGGGGGEGAARYNAPGRGLDTSVGDSRRN